MNLDLSCCQDNFKNEEATGCFQVPVMLFSGHPNIAHFTVGALANQANMQNHPGVAVYDISEQAEPPRV